MTESKKKTPTAGKGGSKGGTRFPRVKLEKACEYAKKLVAKTHTGPQHSDIILPGVFGSATWPGKERASALKQYGLLGGTASEYTATSTARTLNNATDEDAPQLLQQVFLTPSIFKTLFDTFVSDTVTKSKIKSQAGNLNVHPESLEECVDIFVSSAIYAKLAIDNGDSVTFYSTPTQSENTDISEPVEDTNDDGAIDKTNNIPQTYEETKIKHPSSRAAANIDIKIDPSMDPEKLERQLSLLRKFGLI